MQKETDFVRKACVREPRSIALTDGGEIHTSPALRWFGSQGFIFGARTHNYHLSGCESTTVGSQSLEKWEFLLPCESAVIIIIIITAPAAQSDPRSCTLPHQNAQPELRLICRPWVFIPRACITLLVSTDNKWLPPFTLSTCCGGVGLDS